MSISTMANGSLANSMNMGLQAGQNWGASLDEMDISMRMNRIGKSVEQAGGNLLSLDTSSLTSPRDMMALGKYQAQYLQNEHGRNQVFDAYRQWGDNQYKMFSGAMDYLDSLNDPKQWGEAAAAYSKQFGVPFDLEYVPDSMEFRLTQTDSYGQAKDMGQSISFEEAQAMWQGWRSNPETFQRFIMPYAFQTVEQNIRNKQDKDSWIQGSDQSGKAVFLVPQMQPSAKGGFEHCYSIISADGKSPARFATLEQLGSLGISLVSPEQARRGIGLAGVAAGGGSGAGGAGNSFIRHLSKEQQSFIDNHSQVKTVEGGEYYDHRKGEALGILIGNGMDQNMALNYFETSVEELANLYAERTGQSIDSVRAQAVQDVLSVVQRQYSNTSSNPASMSGIVSDGKADPASKNGQQLPDDDLSSQLQDLAGNPMDNPRGDAFYDNKPNGWTDTLYEEFTRITGKAPEPGMTVEQGQQAIHAVEDERTQDHNSNTTAQLAQALGNELRINLPADTSRELIELVRNPPTARQQQNLQNEWRYNIETEDGVSWQEFKSIFGVSPESIGVNPAHGLRILRIVRENNS